MTWAVLMTSEGLSKRFCDIAAFRIKKIEVHTPAGRKPDKQSQIAVREQFTMVYLPQSVTNKEDWKSHLKQEPTLRLHLSEPNADMVVGVSDACAFTKCFAAIKLRCSTHQTVSRTLPIHWLCNILPVLLLRIHGIAEQWNGCWMSTHALWLLKMDIGCSSWSPMMNYSTRKVARCQGLERVVSNMLRGCEWWGHKEGWWWVSIA